MATPNHKTAIVQAATDITPNMRRIDLGGPDLGDFPTGALGGYIKLIFPDEPRTNPDRPVMRTYSIRAHDIKKGILSVDFAMHADTGGLAMEWAMGAKAGTQILISGPGTIKMAPERADWYLIAADMTGLPAALCNLERLPADACGYAVFEVLSNDDKQDITVPPGIDLHWVINPKPDEVKTVLRDAVTALPWHDGTPFIWTACEFDTMRGLRSYYRTDRGVDRTAIYLSSYWRAGRTEDQHKVDKRKDAKTHAPPLILRVYDKLRMILRR